MGHRLVVYLRPPNLTPSCGRACARRAWARLVVAIDAGHLAEDPERLGVAVAGVERGSSCSSIRLPFAEESRDPWHALRMTAA